MSLIIHCSTMINVRRRLGCCETDVVNTYRVRLRYELFRGRLSHAKFQANETCLVDFIKARGNTKPHLAESCSGRRLCAHGRRARCAAGAVGGPVTLSDAGPRGNTEATMAVNFTVKLLTGSLSQGGDGSISRMVERHHSDAGGCAHVAAISAKMALASASVGFAFSKAMALV